MTKFIMFDLDRRDIKKGPRRVFVRADTISAVKELEDASGKANNAIVYTSYCELFCVEQDAYSIMEVVDSIRWKAIHGEEV